MKKDVKYYIKSGLYYLSVLLAIVILTTTLLSLITDTSWRYLKMLDFPRLQYFIFSGIVLVLFIWITKKWRWYDVLFAGMIVASMLLQSTYLVNYTPLVSKTVPDATTSVSGLRLLAYNLYYENENYAKAIKMLESAEADILITLETTPVWEDHLKTLKKDYPYTAEAINKASYGMTIYSKYELMNVERHYLNNNNVPSYSCNIQPTNLPLMQLYSVHPPPPKHFEELPDNAGQEEKALTKIGKRIAKDSMPTIVIGDFNDVAWGNTEELVQADNRLHDIRVGRGFYNTFSAHHFLIKWPLDHCFVTKGFAVQEIQLLDNAGSDHYPLLVELSYLN